MEYADYVQAMRFENPVVAGEVASFQTLENVLDYMRRAGLPLESLDLLTQDEFSHDLILPWPDGRFVVFGLT